MRWQACRRLAAVGLLASQVAVAQAPLERVAGTGDAGYLGLPSANLRAPAAAPDGRVSFLTTATGAFERDLGGITHVVASGQTVPGGLVASTGVPTRDDAGCVVVPVALVEGGDVIFRRCGRILERLVGVGDVTTGGDVIDGISAEAPVVAGTFVAFLGRLATGLEVVLRADGAAVVEIARPDQASPAGGTFGSFRLAGMRPDGHVGFRAVVARGRDGLFSGAGGPVARELLEGDATLVGRLEVIRGATMSQSERWAFAGTLEDGRAGIFRFDGQMVLPLVEAIALTGDAVPTRPGVTFRSFPTSIVPSLNGGGDVSFRATLGGADGGAGLFATRGGSVLALLLTTRDTTDAGVLGRLRDPHLADDGSVLFAATPAREGTGLFVHRGDRTSRLASFGDPTDLVVGDRGFRFSTGRVGATAEGGVFLGELDALMRSTDGTGPETVAATGMASPIGGTFAEIGPPVVDGRGRIFVLAAVSGAARGEGVFMVGARGIQARAVIGNRVPGGRLQDLLDLSFELGGDLHAVGSLTGFAATTLGGKSDGGLFVLKGKRRRRLERVGGTPAPGAEIVALPTHPALVSRRRYAFLATIRDDATREAVVLRDKRRRRIVARTGTPTETRLPGRYSGFTLPDADPSAVVFRAHALSGDAEGVLLDDWSASGLLLASGDPDPQGRPIRSFGRPVLAGARVVVAARVDAASVPRSVLLAMPARLLAEGDVADVAIVAGSGDAVPGGGTVRDLGEVVSTPEGSMLVRLDVGGGRERTMIARIDDGDLDPVQTSQ